MEILKDRLDKKDLVFLLKLIWIGRNHVSPQYYHSFVIVPFLYEKIYCIPNQDTELYMPCLGLLALLRNGDCNGIEEN